MLEIFKKISIKIQEKLISVKNHFLPQDTSAKYHTLGPLNDKKHDEIFSSYEDALIWSLKNKDIYNIAISGPYGAGKSTFLNSFIKKYLWQTRILNILPLWITSRSMPCQFLKISLAHLSNNNEGPVPQIIERSVLQSIFYVENSNKIPQSRFKKISRGSFLMRVVLSLVVSIILHIIILTFYPEYFVNITEFSETVISQYEYGILFLQSMTFIVIFLLALYLFSSKETFKLSFKNDFAEMELDPSASKGKSIFNKYLEEIIYFFEITKYNVVIIEDLDRFEKPEVFTKLRELNLILNNSKDIQRKKGKITFVYAVRDDLFKDHSHRLKFFDFMIPIIPHINAYNSIDLFSEKVKKINFKIDPKFIDNISIYINETRLMNNILNEFIILAKALHFSLDHTKLLALVVYKNLYPGDFQELHNDKGTLYDKINDLKKNIESSINQKEEEIEKVNESIASLKITALQKEQHVFSLFVTKIVEKILETEGSFSSFYLPDRSQEVPLKEAFQNQYFKRHILSNKPNYIWVFYKSQPNTPYKQQKILFQSIEQEIGLNYDALVQSIHEKEEITQLEEKVKVLTDQIITLKSQELIHVDSTNVFTSENDQDKVIQTIVENNQIDLHYRDYLSLFHERDDLLSTDQAFILSVRKGSEIDEKQPITNPEKVLDKLSNIDYRNDYLLNIDLLKFIISNGNSSEIQRTIDEIIHNRVADYYSVRLLLSDNELEQFERELFSVWHTFYADIEPIYQTQTDSTIELVKSCLKNAEVEDIIKIFSNHLHALVSLRSFEMISNEKFSAIFSKLDYGAFTILALDYDLNSRSKWDFVYENNLYILTKSMINIIFTHKYGIDEFDSTWKENLNIANYSAIQSSDLDYLKEYVQDNIGFYIDTVYMEFDDASLEDKNETLIQLLQENNLEDHHLDLIIKKSKKPINDITLFTQNNILEKLFKYGFFEKSWLNLDYIFKTSNELKDELIDLLNSVETVEFLKSQSPQEASEELLSWVLSQNEIPDPLYEFYVSVAVNKGSLLAVEVIGLSSDKIKFLVVNDTLIFDKKIYEVLSDNSFAKGLYLKNNQPMIMDEVEDGFLSSMEDIIIVLKTPGISTSIKQEILNLATVKSLISSDHKFLTEIGQLIFNLPQVTNDKNLIYRILTESHIQQSQKVRIFNVHSELFSHPEEINKILNSWDHPYPDITRLGSYCLLNYSNQNVKLLKYLDKIGYISSFSNHMKKKKKLRVNRYNSR